MSLAVLLCVSDSCLIVQVFEGYGQTECTAGATLTLPGDYGAGHVGAPIPCNRIKLVDVKDMNYFAENGEGEVSWVTLLLCTWLTLSTIALFDSTFSAFFPSTSHFLSFLPPSPCPPSSSSSLLPPPPLSLLVHALSSLLSLSTCY